MRARQIAAGILAAGALVVGCQSTVPGTPQPNTAAPTEPSFSTPRPSRTTTAPPTTPTSPTSPATPAPPSPEALPPQNGYVFIQTKSGQTRCQISEANVGCEAQFEAPPTVGGEPANGVELTADGEVRWLVGNLGAPPYVTIDYRTYSALGWTIEATEAGTRFTNDGTSHGMFVSVQKVDVF